MKKSASSNQRIKELISELSITQTEFCNKTGINKSALSNYLNGNRVPRQDQLQKIADAYQVSPAWLMGYDVPKEMPAITGSSWHFDDISVSSCFPYSTPVERVALYAALVSSAMHCSDEQIDAAIKMLELFRKKD